MSDSGGIRSSLEGYEEISARLADIVAAAIIFVTQGRAIERLRAVIVSQFPGMPNAS